MQTSQIKLNKLNQVSIKSDETGKLSVVLGENKLKLLRQLKDKESLNRKEIRSLLFPNEKPLSNSSMAELSRTLSRLHELGFIGRYGKVVRLTKRGVEFVNALPRMG